MMLARTNICYLATKARFGVTCVISSMPVATWSDCSCRWHDLARLMFLGPALQSIVTLVMLVMMVFMIGEGFLLGRTITNRVRERYPDSTDTG